MSRAIGGLNERVSGEQWALIFALPLGQVSNISIFTVLAGVRNDFGLSYAELGALISVFAIARVVMGVPAGLLARRLNPRTLLSGSLALTLLSCGIGLLSQAAWQFGLARVVHGLTSAVTQAIVLGWLVGGASPIMRGRVMALSEAAFGAVAFVAPIAIGAMAERFGWRAAFGSGLVTGIIAIVAVLRCTSKLSGQRSMGHADASQPEGSPTSIGTAFRAGGGILIAAYLLGVLVFFARQSMLNTIMPLLAADKVGLSPLQIGFGQSLQALLSIPVVLIGGWWGDRVGRRAALVPGVAILLLTQLSVFFVTSPATYLAVSAFQSAGYVINSFPTSLVGDSLHGRARSQGIVMYRLIADGALLVAPIVTGLVLQAAGFEFAKVIGFVPTLAVLVAIVALVPEAGRTPVAGWFKRRKAR